MRAIVHHILRALLAAGALAPTARLGAQVVEAQIGGDSYQHGIGLVARFWGERYDGWIGAGHQDGPRVGAFVQFRFRRDSLRLGNDAVALRYPTDVFGLSYSVLVQGASWIATRGPVRTTVFTGASATSLGVPLFAAQRHERPVIGGAVVAALSPGLRLFSRLILTTRQSFHTGLEWRDSTRTSLALTTGLGSNRPFGVLSATRVRERYEVRASWTVNARGYQRADLPTPVLPHLVGPALEVIVRPREWLAITATQQTFVTDSGRLFPQSRATGRSLIVTANGVASHASLAVADASLDGGRDVSAYAAVGRAVGERFAIDAYALGFRPRGLGYRVTPVLMLHERATSTIVLNQTLTLSGSQLSTALGGTWAGALADVGVGYQVVHAPLSPDGPFLSTLHLSLRFNLGEHAINVATQIQPDGRARYTASAVRFFHFNGVDGISPHRATVRLGKLVVRGLVIDEAGVPIAGAAIAIGETIAFTASDGRFFVRRRKREVLSVEVRTEEFLTAAAYTVALAPPTATAEPEASAPWLRIVLHRTR